MGATITAWRPESTAVRGGKDLHDGFPAPTSAERSVHGLSEPMRGEMVLTAFCWSPVKA